MFTSTTRSSSGSSQLTLHSQWLSRNVKILALAASAPFTRDRINPEQQGRKEMFYLTTHSTHFICGYMASDIWLRTIQILRKETRCSHIGYSYWLTARVHLYAPSHRQDSTYYGLCYSSCGALTGTRNTEKQERETEMFYLTTHSTHFIYGYMVSDIWLRTILIVRKKTRCRHIGYSYWLTARVRLYAPSHRQDSTYYGLCYTSRGALTGTRNTEKQERETEMFYLTTHSTLYLRLYGVRHIVKDHSDSEKGNPLPPHRLLLSINSKGSFICTIPQTG